MVWRQEKLLAFFKMFEKSIDVYIENQNFAKKNEALFEALPAPSTNKKEKTKMDKRKR